jgi:levanbiose-producing levanase
VRLRILVDRTSVEMFVDDGRYVHSSQAFPYLIDTGLALFSIGGTAVFRNTVIREFSRARY